MANKPLTLLKRHLTPSFPVSYLRLVLQVDDELVAAGQDPHESAAVRGRVPRRSAQLDRRLVHSAEHVRNRSKCSRFQQMTKSIYNYNNKALFAIFNRQVDFCLCVCVVLLKRSIEYIQKLEISFAIKFVTVCI